MAWRLPPSALSACVFRPRERVSGETPFVVKPLYQCTVASGESLRGQPAGGGGLPQQIRRVSQRTWRCNGRRVSGACPSESHVTCSLSSPRRPLCCSSRRGSCGSGTERRFRCTGRDIGLPRGASAARSPELLFGVSMSARSRRTPTWAARYGAPAPAARLVIHVHLLWSCTVCRTLWTTSSGQLSRM